MSKSYKLGSHDTMTYLKPKSWILRPFHFVAKCQNVDIEKQYEYGARMFDIRLKYNFNEADFVFAHGCMEFTGTTYDHIFAWLDDKAKESGEPIYVRMVLEYNREPKSINWIVEQYVALCKNLRSNYKNLIFFGFNRKYDWKTLYSYEGMPYPSIYQAISSMTWKIWDDWFPWLYAKTHNKDNYAQGTTADWLLMDFVEIR